MFFAAVVAVVVVLASLAGVGGSGSRLQVRSADIVDGTIKSRDLSPQAIGELGVRGAYQVDMGESSTGVWTATYPYESGGAVPTLTYGDRQSGVMDAVVKFARRDQTGVLQCTLAAVTTTRAIMAQSSDRVNWSDPGDDTLTLRTLTDTAHGTMTLHPQLSCTSTARIAWMQASLVMESTTPSAGVIP